MCLGIPAQIVSLEKPGLAVAEVSGVRREVSTALVPEAGLGDWVLVHVGFALHTIDEAEAARTLELLDEVDFGTGEPMVPPWTPSFAGSTGEAVRGSGESAVSPPPTPVSRSENRNTKDGP